MSETEMAPATFDFSLVGTWWLIPVADEAEADRAIRRIVDDAAGRRDELANLRRILRDQLASTVADARSVRAEHLYLARDIAPGVPLSAALGIYWPRLNSLPSDVAASPKLARAYLKAALHEGDSAGEVHTEHEFDVAAGAVLRRTYLAESRAEEDGPSTTTLRADYWMTSPRAGRFVLLSFSSQFAALEEQLVAFFDEIVTSIVWTGRDAAPA